MDNEISALRETVNKLIKQEAKSRKQIRSLQKGYDNIVVCLRKKDEAYEELKARIEQTEYDITAAGESDVQLADKIELIEEILEDAE